MMSVQLISPYRLVVAALFIASFSFPPAHAANVTLASLTLLRSLTLLSAPKVYIQCDDSPQIELPDVNSILKQYTFTGKEPWQPVMQLPPGECRKCAVYQDRFPLGAVALASWPTCYADFAATQQQGTPSVAHYSPNWLVARLNCSGCTEQGGSASASTFSDGSTSTSTVPDVGSSLAPFKWTGIGLIIGGCLIAIVGVVVWYFLMRRSKKQEAALAESKLKSTDPLAKEEEGAVASE